MWGGLPCIYNGYTNKVLMRILWKEVFNPIHFKTLFVYPYRDISSIIKVGYSIVNDDEFTVSWLSKSGVGIALLLEPTEKFGLQKEVMTTNRHSLSFILKYLKEYRKYLFQIFLGLLFGCVLQLILPFLTNV